jgi:rare lipoprotein A
MEKVIYQKLFCAVILMPSFLSPSFALNVGSEQKWQQPAAPVAVVSAPATTVDSDATVIQSAPQVQPEIKPVSVQTGVASWYRDSRTASGERYKAGELTAAHRRLPLGTYVRVTNLVNNQSTVVRINDRGPYVKGRMLDLSVAAAKKLAMIQSGVTRIRMEVLPSAPREAAM